jgi:hypothetical protein
MKARAGKHNKVEGRLIGVAESIGSTIGTIVGSANAAQKALTQSQGMRSVKRRGKKLVRKSQKATRRTKTQR